MDSNNPKTQREQEEEDAYWRWMTAATFRTLGKNWTLSAFKAGVAYAQSPAGEPIDMVPTNGVAAIKTKGSADSPIAGEAAARPVVGAWQESRSMFVARLEHRRESQKGLTVDEVMSLLNDCDMLKGDTP